MFEEPSLIVQWYPRVAPSQVILHRILSSVAVEIGLDFLKLFLLFGLHFSVTGHLGSERQFFRHLSQERISLFKLALASQFNYYSSGFDGCHVMIDGSFASTHALTLSLEQHQQIAALI